MVIVIMRTQSLTLDENESREFWKKYGLLIKFINFDREENIIISKKDLKKVLQKLPYWKAPGKDGLQGSFSIPP